MTEHERILKDLADAVVDMDEVKAAACARQALDTGMEAHMAILEGLSRGMDEVGRRFETGEYFIPQLLVCSDAMYAGIDVLKPHLREDFTSRRSRVVIGVMEGDTHDIGKNLVKLMLEAANFEVLDLGRDVPLETFVSQAEAFDASLVCMSTLMTTTMDRMRDVVRALGSGNGGGRFKTMVGGGPVSQAFADRIGADGYAGDAVSAVQVAKGLLGDDRRHV